MVSPSPLLVRPDPAPWPFTVTPLSAYTGAEISGIDLGQPLSAPVIDAINQALGHYGVVVFRDQDLTPEQHIALARQFGEIDINRFFRATPEHREIAEVRKDPEQRNNIGGKWHTDHSYDQIPAKGSLLYARVLPPIGGDTLFASMYAAWDALSDGLKQTLRGLKAHHSSRHAFGYAARARPELADLNGRLGNPEQAVQDAIHPIALRHPETGRTALYVNPGFTTGIVGWTESESQALLGFLFQHAVRPEFTLRLAWRPGTLAFWDNRSTWHLALNDYQGQARLLHRITIAGGPLD